MDAATHLAHLRADVSRLLEAARAEPDAPVAACPGWDRRTLVKHLCIPYGWATAQAEAGPDEKRGFKDAPRPGDDDDVFAFLDAAADRVVAALGGIDTTIDWPTFMGPRPGSWFPRRMAQETSIHTFDGAGGPIDGALAVDGIDELLDEFSPMLGPDAFGGESCSLHLHATDLPDGEWLVTLGPERVAVERAHAKGDVAVRGTASDLVLFAWNRVPVDDRFDIHGDRAVAERWGSIVRI